MKPHLPSPPPVPRERIVMIAKRIVELWETIPQRSEDFFREHAPNWDADQRRGFVEMLRNVAGGEELYHASLEFLKGEAEEHLKE